MGKILRQFENFKIKIWMGSPWTATGVARVVFSLHIEYLLIFGGLCKRYSWDIYCWKFTGYLIFYMVFQFLLQSFCSKSIVDMLTEVDHVTNYLKKGLLTGWLTTEIIVHLKAKPWVLKCFAKSRLQSEKHQKLKCLFYRLVNYV